MIVVLIGRPESGKGTQSTILAKELNLPVFAMGELIRDAMVSDPQMAQAYNQYALKGRHLPNSIKFSLLKNKLDKIDNGFILDNYPATQEDLETFNNYLGTRGLRVDKVFHIVISEEEAIRRMKVESRGRLDDDESVIRERLGNQDEDRKPVIEHFRKLGLLEEIDGEREISAIHGDIMARLGISQRERNGI